MTKQILNSIVFIILLSGVCFGYGSPDYLPDGNHPRIWLTSSELSRLSALRDSSDAKWTALETWCDSHISDAGYNVDPPDPLTQDLTRWSGDNSYTGYRMSGWATHIYNYAFAYQVLKQAGTAQNTTKASSYANRAMTLLVDGIATALRAGEENNGLQSIRVGELRDSSINASEAAALGITQANYKNGYSARNLMAVPVAYDWIYDTLSSDDKALLSSMMLRWYDWLIGKRSTYNNGVLKDGVRYYEDQDGDCTGSNNCTSLTGTATKGYDVYNIANNFGSGDAGLISLIAVATYGDYADDDTYYSEIRTFLDTYAIAPLSSDLLHSGGDSPEGWNYGGGFMYLVPGLYGFYTATGYNSIAGFDWFGELVTASLHRVSGDLQTVPLWGYWTGSPMSENRINHIAPFVWVENNLNPTSSESKTGRWLLENSTFTSSLELWQSMLYGSPVSASSPVSESEPLDYVATGNGLYNSRSSWDISDDVVALTTRLEGKITTSHEGYDEGHISLLRGPDILLGHQNSVGDAPPSVSFNSIVFNDLSHHGINPGLTSTCIDRKKSGTGYSYVSGDITNAWKRQYNTSRCELFRRSVLHIRPGVIVISDVTRSSSLGNNKKWYTQYVADPTISGNTVSALVGNSKVFVETVYPTGGTYTETNPTAGFYRVAYSPATEQEYDQFLTVIEATGSTSSQTDASIIAGVGCRGALVGTSAAIFTSDQSYGLISTATYTTDATIHYIADLPKNTAITVTRGGTIIVEAANSGDSGMIVFSATSGSAEYAVVVGEDQPTYDAPTITGPVDFSTTSTSVEIEGTYTVDPDLTDQSVIVTWTIGESSGFCVAALGVFSCTVPVELGTNNIVFEITDSNSGTANDSITITRTIPGEYTTRGAGYTIKGCSLK